MRASEIARPVIGVDVPWPDELVIEVTQERIEVGLAGDCNKCPIAIGANAATGRTDASVIYGHVRFVGAVYRLPDEADDFMATFDLLEFVAPRTFTATLIK